MISSFWYSTSPATNSTAAVHALIKDPSGAAANILSVSVSVSFPDGTTKTYAIPGSGITLDVLGECTLKYATGIAGFYRETWVFTTTDGRTQTAVNTTAVGLPSNAQSSPSFIYVEELGADPTGLTDSTSALMGAWNSLKAVGYGTLWFRYGTYLTKDLLFQNGSNFSLIGDRGVTIYHSPNTASSPGQAAHNVCVVADCSDFTIEGITFDARRDTIAADQFLQFNAASGQKNVTAQDGTKYFLGQAVSVFGGLTANGGNEKNFNDSNLTISAINGNVLTLSANLANSYTATGATGGAWITQYQTGGVVPYTIAGRALGNEDAQNGLHLINCTRYRLENVMGQNTWESPIKCGTGFNSTSVNDGCSHGLLMGCDGKHGYDQGLSIWNSSYITILGGGGTDVGWAGVSLSHCNDCDVIAPSCTNNVYSPPFDLNEGTGVALEGCVRVTVDGAVCSGNNSNGVRLNISPMFGGAALNQGVSGSLVAGATSITLTGANGAFVNGGSYTIVDPNNSLIRENIYCTGVNGAVITISPGLRNNYTSGPTIYGRFGEDCTIMGSNCSLSVLSAGIHADQQINLTLFGNDCSKNGFNGTAFTDTQGCYGIHLHGLCMEATLQNNTCCFNAKEGILIDNTNQAVILKGNKANHNGISGTNQAHGIKLYGLVDGAIDGNECNFNTGCGIYSQTGNLSTARDSILHNTCLYNSSSGIWLDNAGATLTVGWNKVGFSSDVNLKVLGVRDSLFLSNQCYNSAGQEGIRFDDGTGTNYCTDNKVLDNWLYDDRGTPTQSWGFNELNHSARTILSGNRVYGNTNAAQVSLSATSALVSDVGYRTAVSGNYTALFTDSVIAYTSTTSAFTVTLPAPASVPGHTYTIKDESGGAATHNITVKSVSGNIDATLGSTGVPISTNYGVVRLYSNGSNYYTI